jgi:hypothetical protein
LILLEDLADGDGAVLARVVAVSISEC